MIGTMHCACAMISQVNFQIPAMFTKEIARVSTSVSRVAGCRATALLIVLTAVWVLCAGAHAQQTKIERGEYLVRAGDCISCHTAKGGAPFAGGLRMDTPFGYLLAPNITPDAETGIGKWSADDFYRALHDGVNKRGQDMYPVMPYDFYTKVTRRTATPCSRTCKASRRCATPWT